MAGVWLLVGLGVQEGGGTGWVGVRGSVWFPRVD